MVILDVSVILSPYVQNILGGVDPSTFTFPAELSSALKEKHERIRAIAGTFQIPPVGLASVYEALEKHKDWYERGIAPAAQGGQAYFQASFSGRARAYMEEWAGEQVAQCVTPIVAETVTLCLIHSSMILALDAMSSLTWATLTEVFGSDAVTSISLEFVDPGPFRDIPMSLESIVAFRPRLIQIVGPPLNVLERMRMEDCLTLCRANAFTIRYDQADNER